MPRAVLALLLSTALAGGGAQAAVQVSYSDPGRFTDADRAGGLMTAEGAVRSLAALVESLGRKLPPGADLLVEILDLDLAGRIAPELDPSGARRVFDRRTWPRIRLRFTLTESGRVVARGEELISWQDYLDRATARFAGDPLRFEKAMLTEWFETRIARRWGDRRLSDPSSSRSAETPRASHG